MLKFAAEVLAFALQYIPPNEVLEGGINYDAIPLSRLQAICFHVGDGLDEISLFKKLSYLKEWVFVQLEVEGWQKETNTKAREEGISILDMIHCLVSKLLDFQQGRLVYRYKYLEIWDFLNRKIGINLFAASYYARRDYKKAFERRVFTDTEVVYHDNYVLNEVLSRGLAENHFHLRCSTPYFTLSWLSLMNSVTRVRIANQLDQMGESPRNPKVRYRYSYEEDSFSLRHLKAAVIRVYLYAFLTGEVLELGTYYAPMKWLLGNILEMEPVMDYLGSITLEEAEGYVGESITPYLEEELGDRAGEFQEHCKGFYWLFWVCYPQIPMECFTVGSRLLDQENQDRIVEYIEETYQPMPLGQCAWLFQGHYQEKYRAEWDWQGKMAIWRLLANPNELLEARDCIQYAIDGFHANSSSQQKDYALNSVEWEWDEWEQAVATGERWLIYQMEYRRFYYEKGEKEQEDGIYNLFFAYLLIKESFRNELLQNNDKIGFQNFQIYQKRKDWFTTAFSEEELAQIAVKGAFHKQCLKSLELRLMPADSDVKNIHMLRLCDKAIGQLNFKSRKKADRKYYYVFHFGKKKDSVYKGGEMRCRHKAFRGKLKRQSNAIMSMREKNPRVGERLKGIDACSSEDGCRPEVFAVAFRTLKNHSVYRTDVKEKLSQLRISYHVGEENQDVLDGLRAIDEAVYFLNMGSGDRLGHATMLGIDVEAWYNRNGCQISIRQHDYLDNVAWLYHKIIYFHISNQDNLLEFLEREFQVFFNRIYEKNMSIDYNQNILREKEENFNHNLSFDIYNYYYGWELRGDAPELYVDGFYRKELIGADSWGDQAINKSIKAEQRKIPEAGILYHTYHYNPAVRAEGDKPVTIKIPYYMICGIAEVQKKMQKQIAKRGIAIETNPSSNLLIGGLPGYESHPIISFYNKGLVGDISKLEACPQINVSINTDDPGVFITSLYNEYTLMAGALENLKDKDGNHVYKKDMIYDWINNIRKMGKKQAFSKEVIKEENVHKSRGMIGEG